MTTFDMPIAIFPGHSLAIDALPEPTWRGTLREFLDANAAAYTFGEAREMLSVLDYGRMVPVGGGAAPAQSLISEAKLREMRFWHKIRALAA